MNKIKISKITELSMLAGIAAAISIIDKIISGMMFSMIPGIKIGLANVIIIVSIIKYSFKDTLIVVLLKSIITGLLFGSISTFIIGGISSLLSFLVMYYIYKKGKHLSLISISIIGGFIHINTQLLILGFIYSIGKEIYIYGFLLIIISFFTSIIIGMISSKLNVIYQNNIIIK